MTKPSPNRVMSGMRATGKLHLGHYVGVLKNWVELQEQYDCYFMVADWHSLTTNYENPEMVKENSLDMILDWLAAGIDPSKSKLYIQSHLTEIAELHLLLSMLTPQKWLETSPTLKDMIENLNQEITHGLLGYPVLQTADILIVKGEIVPVGKDQLAHLELSRDIVTRFNHVYKTNVFPPPQPKITQYPALPGLDGKKMSKSLNNTIGLSNTAEETEKLMNRAITDPARIKRTDPGDPERCEVVFKYYQVFASETEQQAAAAECRSAERGCSDCKKILADIINTQMAPLRERRAKLEQSHQVQDILAEGLVQTRQEAQTTLDEVRHVMKLR